MIGESLKINTTLTYLGLWSNDMIQIFNITNNIYIFRTDNKIGTEGAKSLSEALKINSSLTKLNLSGEEPILLI